MNTNTNGTEQLKTCTQCASTHPDTTDFYRKRSQGRGLEAICKVCWRLKARAYSQVKRANGFTREHKAKDRRIAYVNAIKLERGCVDCGYKSNVIALEFDHLPEHPLKARIANLFKMEDINAEMEKCEVVCANCHKIRTAQRNQQNGRPVLPVPESILTQAQGLAQQLNPYQARITRQQRA
jgi:hypothetical protein